MEVVISEAKAYASDWSAEGSTSGGWVVGEFAVAGVPGDTLKP